MHHFTLSFSRTLTVSPALLPMTWRIPALTGSMCWPLPIVMTLGRFVRPALVPTTKVPSAALISKNRHRPLSLMVTA